SAGGSGVAAAPIGRFVRLAILVVGDPFTHRLPCLEVSGALEGAVDAVPLPIADRFPVLGLALRPSRHPVGVVLDDVTIDNLSLLRGGHIPKLNAEPDSRSLRRDKICDMDVSLEQWEASVAELWGRFD